METRVLAGQKGTKRRVCNANKRPQDDSEGRVTRKRSAMTGRIKKVGLVEGSGYALIEVKRIQDCVSSAAIRGKCRNPKSKLTLFEDENGRKVLAQQFSLKCSLRKTSTELVSSRKTKAKGTFGVNLRAVHAASKGLGLKGLSRFCASADLPKPPNAKSFHVILKNLSDTAHQQAVKCTKQAAERLIKITQEEEPENVVADEDESVSSAAAQSLIFSQSTHLQSSVHNSSFFKHEHFPRPLPLHRPLNPHLTSSRTDCVAGSSRHFIGTSIPSSTSAFANRFQEEG
eukprot:gene10109-18769_t